MDTKKIQLGIIVPTYDSLDTLQVLIAQIYHRTTGVFHVIVVEDGQKPETIEWLKQSNHLCFHVVYHPENKGVSPSWNDGLRKAEELGCTHFAIFNDDIEIPENWWTDCLSVFEAKKANVVGLVDPCPTPLTGWFFILDKTCLEKVGYFDESFAPYMAEDDDYYYRIKESGVRFIRIGLKVFHHGSHTINKLWEKDPKYVKAVFDANWKKLRAKHPKIRLMAR